MHIFLYEWITGGGLVEEPARLPASLLAEGSAMISRAGGRLCRAADGASHRPARHAASRACSFPTAKSWRSTRKCIGASEFDRLAAAADWTMVVAPEFDGILRKYARAS